MRVRLLSTNGDGKFVEHVWDKPEPADDEIEVRAVMTGVCRSDIDMMNGDFGPLPLHMQGHEGLGIVTKIGANIREIKVGDYVATRGEPAYADYYNVRHLEFTLVPKLEPKYILEPVACAVNCVKQQYQQVRDRAGGRLLILGSGFLAWVVYNTIINDPMLNFPEIHVVGNSNRDLWLQKLQPEPVGEYDVIIDLSNRTDIFDKPIVSANALIIFGVQKKVTTDFGNLLWKACSIVFPSPRNPRFHLSMQMAAWLIEDGYVEVDKFWTKGYNRDTEWQQAFADGNNRPQNYSRGYIYWSQDGN
jgi:threonine dehydrogenase-like Zn-dependent dehydrogenase